jgi:hypothetical protein
MAPGSSRAMWLDEYEQIFSFPPDQLSVQSFIALGFKEIARDRLSAFQNNLIGAVTAHGAIILFPFIIAGIYIRRNDERVKLAGFSWLILFLTMTFIFPFPGARGAFFHAGSAFQPIWWTLAPIGLGGFLSYLHKNKWAGDRAQKLAPAAVAMVVIILTVFSVYIRLFTLEWDEGEKNYPAVEQALLEYGIEPDDIVIVRNAPGYYIQTGRSAIPIPYEGVEAVLNAAKKYEAAYFILEPDALTPALEAFSNQTTDQTQFIYLGQVEDILLFKIVSE